MSVTHMPETARPVPAVATGSTWRPHPQLYQINTWVWLDELSAAAGCCLHLGDVPDREWDRLAGLGFDLVYLLGVWRRSLAGRRIFRTSEESFHHFDQALPGWRIGNVVGSPFSISRYEPDPHIGTWQDIDAVRAKLHERGMRLILDFVPNHVGPDHHWIAEHPELLLRGEEEDFHRDPGAFVLIEPPAGPPQFVARGRDPYFAPWADTAQVDYFNPDARTAMIDVLRELGQHCDGLRCDMAMLVLNEVFARTWNHLLRGRVAPPSEFWPEAIAALPAGFLWMAEVYWDMEARLQSLGFNFTYDKRLSDRLRAAPAHEVRAHLTASLDDQARMARFLENHDETRSVAAYGRHRVPGLATLVATLPGLRFFHQGQFEGKTIHLPMALDRALPEAPDPALGQFYEKLLRVVDDELFHEGRWQLLDVGPDNGDTHANLVAYCWQSESGFALVVVNLSADAAQGRIPIADRLASAGRYAFDDVLDGARYLRERGELSAHGLFVRLEAFGAHLFRVSLSIS